MLLTEVAYEYSSLNTYYSHTKETLHRVARLFTERLKIKSLLDINLESLVEYRNHMNRLNLALATFNGYLGHLRVLDKYASDQGYFSETGSRDLARCQKLVEICSVRRCQTAKNLSPTALLIVSIW